MAHDERYTSKIKDIDLIRGKYLEEKLYQNILSKFPNILSCDWDESSCYSAHYISIWNKWLIDTDTPELLETATKNEETKWHNKFRKLHEYILSNTEVYFIYQNKLKKIKTSKYVLNYMDEFLCCILLPEMKIIYTVETDFTSRVFFQNNNCKAQFDSWIKESELKYIEYN